MWGGGRGVKANHYGFNGGGWGGVGGRGSGGVCLRARGGGWACVFVVGVCGGVRGPLLCAPILTESLAAPASHYSRESVEKKKKKKPWGIQEDYRQGSMRSKQSAEEAEVLKGQEQEEG